MEPYILKLHGLHLNAAVPTPNQPREETQAILATIWGGKDNIPNIAPEDKAQLSQMQLPKIPIPPKATFAKIVRDGKTYFLCEGKEYPVVERKLTSLLHAYERGPNPVHLKDVGQVRTMLEIGGPPISDDATKPCTMTPLVNTASKVMSTPVSRMENDGLTQDQVQAAAKMLLDTAKKLTDHRKVKGERPITFADEEYLPSEPWMHQATGSLTINRGEDRFVSEMEEAVDELSKHLHVKPTCAGPPPRYLAELKREIVTLEKDYADTCILSGPTHWHAIQRRNEIDQKKRKYEEYRRLVGIE